MITKSTKIYIAGHRGMVGSAVWRVLESKGYSNLISKTSSELDLRNQQAVNEFYNLEKPEVVIDAAAKAVVKSCDNPNYQIEIGKEVLSVDPSYFRPTEVDLLIGDPSKAKNKLGWVPEYDLTSLVKDMMEGDVSLMKKDVTLLKVGHEIFKQSE